MDETEGGVMPELSYKQFESYWNFWSNAFGLTVVFAILSFVSVFLAMGDPEWDKSDPLMGKIFLFFVAVIVCEIALYWLCKIVYNERTFLDYCARGPLWKKRG